MPPIDYSKWDNIDTDSEPEMSSPQVPAPAPAPKGKEVAQPPAPAPVTQQQSHSSASTSTATPPTPDATTSGPVQAVIVRCEGDKGVRAPPWSGTTIPADHPVFSQAVAPIPGLIGIPLVMHRVGTRSADRADLDNQIATYLNIEPDSGFAPAHWQSHVGTVVVARKDRRPLLPHHLEGVWMYCDRILDLFGEGGGPPTRLYNRRAFEQWWREYCEQQRGSRPGSLGERDPDDWRAVRSPFEM